MRISIERYCVAPRSQRKPQAMIDSSGSDSEMQRFESCRLSHAVGLSQVRSPAIVMHTTARRGKDHLKGGTFSNGSGHAALNARRACSKPSA
jgi:hypothetical protein